MDAPGKLKVPSAFGWRKLDRPVIRIRELQHWFGTDENRKQVLRDVNLDVKAGEVIIMTGPSGSGKTTLLTIVGALRSVQEGSVEVLGRQMRGMTTEERARLRRDIGFIFQAHNLFDSLTAFQNVRMALELRDESAAEMETKVTSILTRLGLAHRMHYKPGSLSGGQRQRVAIARALVAKPELILADEPTAALDKDSGREVIDLLHDLAKKERCAILLVTHDNRILDKADRIVRMIDGSVATNVDIEESIQAVQSLSHSGVVPISDPVRLGDLAQKMTREYHPEGSIIFQQGDPGDKFYLIRHGAVELLMHDGDEERVIASLNPGQYFGERALVTNQPRNLTARAKEDSELLVLDKPVFRAVIDSGRSLKEQLRDVFFSQI